MLGVFVFVYMFIRFRDLYVRKRCGHIWSTSKYCDICHVFDFCCWCFLFFFGFMLLLVLVFCGGRGGGNALSLDTDWCWCFGVAIRSTKPFASSFFTLRLALTDLLGKLLELSALEASGATAWACIELRRIMSSCSWNGVVDVDTFDEAIAETASISSSSSSSESCRERLSMSPAPPNESRVARSSTHGIVDRAQLMCSYVMMRWYPPKWWHHCV